MKGIFTDGFPPQCVLKCDKNISMKLFVEKYLSDADVVVCGSELVYNRYREHVKRCYFATCAYDPNLFRRNSKKSKNENSRFVVGWTGNPDRRFKGFFDFVVPAVNRAKEQRPGIELKTRFSGPLHTLPRFYDDVDVVLIASEADAGPSLFEEASGCEVPSISTVIGKPAEVIVHGVNGYLVERSVDDMSDTIVSLYDDRDLLFSMSQQIRSDFLRHVEGYVQGWIHVFNEVLSQ